MRDRWLDEGMTVLADQGAGGLRVDRIASRLGLTKGSFHHHFNGMADYRRSILERFEAESAEAVRAAVAASSGVPPEQALMELPAHISFDTRIEAAIRGWAFEDEGAGAVLARVDSARLDALIDLWERILPGSPRARVAALVPHLLMIGASVTRPTPTEAEVRDVFSLLATLVPSVR